MAAVSFSSTTPSSSIHDFGHPLKRQGIHSTISSSSIPKHDLFANWGLSLLQFSFLSEKRRALVSRVSRRFNFLSKESEKRSTIFRLDNFIIRVSHHFISRHIKANTLPDGPLGGELLKEFQCQLNKFSEEIISKNSFIEEINLYAGSLRPEKYSFIDRFRLIRVIDLFTSESFRFLKKIIHFVEKEKTKEDPKSFQKIKKLTFNPRISQNPKKFKELLNKLTIKNILEKINKDTFPLLQTIEIIKARKIEVAFLLSSNRDNKLDLIINKALGEEDGIDDNSPLIKIDPAPLISMVNPAIPNFFDWFNNFSFKKIVYTDTDIEEGVIMDNHTIFENSPGLQELSFSSLLPGESYLEQSETIDKVFKSFQNLTSLTLLDMHSWSADSLCTRIANLTNLKSLSLSFSSNRSVFADGQYETLPREKLITGSSISKTLVPSLTYLNLDLKGIYIDHQLITRVRSLSSLTTLILTESEKPLLNFAPVQGLITEPLEKLTYIGENSSIRHLEFRNIFCGNSKIVFACQINNLTTFCNKIFQNTTFKGCIKIVENGLDDSSHAQLTHTFSNYPKVNIANRKAKVFHPQHFLTIVSGSV